MVAVVVGRALVFASAQLDSRIWTGHKEQGGIRLEGESRVSHMGQTLSPLHGLPLVSAQTCQTDCCCQATPTAAAVCLLFLYGPGEHLKGIHDGQTYSWGTNPTLGLKSCAVTLAGNCHAICAC